MRTALVTLLPMLAAAGAVLVGGERLARVEIEQRTAADRERLLDFADAFETELDRLDALYRSHLDGIAEEFRPGGRAKVEERARDYSTIRAVHLLTPGNRREELSLAPAGSGQRLPEIVLEGRDRPLNPGNAVVIPDELLDWQRDGASGWLPTPDPMLQLYWTRPAADRLVAFVVDRPELRGKLETHLAEWIKNPLTPLREAGERYAIRGPAGQTLASAGGGTHRGPAALLMPFRTGLGEWQVQAWDRITVSTAHDTATLTTSGAIAALLALGGLFLYIQQRRALALAEERVSFVNRVSHELGTPLTNVALNLDLACEALEIRPTEARRRLAIVSEEIERLGRLVANVLTFSRRERRTLKLEAKPCTPDLVIGQTLDSFRPALLRREIEIAWDANAAKRVRLDPDALGQIVGNLFSNVEKYAADGRSLGITSTLEGELLVVEVSDLGPGIPPRSREIIFQPFERVHRAVNEGSSGTGLGLTIARELATRMGGSLVLLDAEEGTRFELRLPAPPVLAVVPHDESSAA